MNVIQNPDFNSGLTGWTVASGTFAIDPADGLPGQPSLHATAASAGGYEAFVNSPCLQMSAPQNVDLSANIKFASGTAAEVDVYGYADTTCANFASVITLVSAPQDGMWGTRSATNVALPTGTQSVMVQLVTGSASLGGSVDAHFDHILFGPTGAPATASVPAISFIGLALLGIGIVLAGSLPARANYSLKRTAVGRLR